MEPLTALAGAAAGIGLAAVLIATVFFVVGVGSFVLWIWSIVDAVRFSDEQWQRAGQNKMLWVILIVLLGALGSLLYVFIPRSAVKAARLG